MLFNSEVSQESRDLLLTHILRMLLIMIKDVSFDPVKIGFFSSNTIMADADCISYLIEQLWLCHTRLLALLEIPIRLPNRNLSCCFYLNPEDYTPEKPSVHRAFRVSTYS